MNKVVKTDAEWRAQLNDLEFKVLRKHGTERAFTNDNFPKEPGMFTCKGCGAPLFDQAHNSQVIQTCINSMQSKLFSK